MADYPPQGFMDKHPDIAFMILSDQIAADYQTCVKDQLAPDLEIFKTKSLRELHVLLTAYLIDRPVQPKELSHLLRYDRATISRAVKNLIENGMMAEKVDESDLRSILVNPTQTGRDVIDRYLDLSNKFFSSVKPALGAYNPREPYMILTSLIKLRNRTERIQKFETESEK